MKAAARRNPEPTTSPTRAPTGIIMPPPLLVSGAAAEYSGGELWDDVSE